jgi:hypothetical protein
MLGELDRFFALKTGPSSKPDYDSIPVCFPGFFLLVGMGCRVFETVVCAINVPPRNMTMISGTLAEPDSTFVPFV